MKLQNGIFSQGKKEKTKILDEYCATVGNNRKYAMHVLKNMAYMKTTNFNKVQRWVK